MEWQSWVGADLAPRSLTSLCHTGSGEHAAGLNEVRDELSMFERENQQGLEKD